MSYSFDASKLISEGNEETIRIDSNYIEECMEYYFKHNLETILIDPLLEYKAKDIAFVEKYPKIRGVSIEVSTSKYELDLAPLQLLKELTFLAVGDCRQSFDFSCFPKLHTLCAKWHLGMRFSKKNYTIKYLSLSHFNPKSKSLKDLPNAYAVEELHVFNCPITNLEGLDKFKKLKNAQFHYMRKLESIAGLKSESLEHLHIGTCRKIKDHEQATKLRSLKILRLNDCGTIKSLSFLKEFPKLEDFRFVDTDVADGDLTPLLRLKSTSFTDKKHFSHKLKDIKKAIGDTGP